MSSQSNMIRGSIRTKVPVSGVQYASVTMMLLYARSITETWRSSDVKAASTQILEFIRFPRAITSREVVV